MSSPARAGTPLVLALGALGLAAAAGCGEPLPPPAATGPLPPGIAARAGNETVRVESVAHIAAAQRISLREARDHAVRDALFAAAVRADPTAHARVSSAERSVLARAVVERIRDETRAAGPPSDEEVRTLTAQRWPELDRPSSVRTTHAVVLVKSPADNAPARALATTLAAALRGATTSRDFIERAQKLPKGALEIRAEELPPVTTDGRLWDPAERPPKPVGATLDLDFTRAAHALEQPGAQSGIVKSAFGYHVILLDERYPAVAIPLEERRVLLEGEILSRRGRREFDALASRLRTQTPVTTERAADELTALVTIEP